MRSLPITPESFALPALPAYQFTNFTTADAFQNQLPGQQSAFITRIDASGTTPLYSTYFGGSYVDGGNAIALDSQGNGYITGYTTSSDFPHTGGAFQGSLNGNQNVFVAKWVFPIVPTPTTTPTGAATPTYCNADSDSAQNQCAAPHPHAQRYGFGDGDPNAHPGRLAGRSAASVDHDHWRFAKSDQLRPHAYRPQPGCEGSRPQHRSVAGLALSRCNIPAAAITPGVRTALR